MTRKHLVLGVIVLLLVFAVQGGEYSTLDYYTLQHEARDERARIEVLRREVDSLEREARLVETDLETQERLARELYGMLQDGEFAYFIERQSSSDRDRTGRRGFRP